jgi:predicted AAA+ superfamily ATPase
VKRTLTDQIVKDLKEKMVFLSGPRQVGKTYLAQHELVLPSQYLNWDYPLHRKKILARSWDMDKKLIVFDELHKYSQWKNFLKGEYDIHKNQYQYLVTGSARMDIYRRGGDSLLGRFHHLRMHPFSLAELSPKKSVGFSEKAWELNFNDAFELKQFNQLLQFGGFPEPFLKKDAAFVARWQVERKERLIKEDIRDLSLVRDISQLQVLADMLPERVGSLFSINAIRQDLQVNHATLTRWVETLELFYYCYRIYPWQNTKIKSLKKEPKLYLWDWAEVQQSSARLENMIASHLLKWCHYLQDCLGLKVELWFLRDTEQREADFLVTFKGAPWFAVEVKENDTNIPASLHYFKDKLKIPWTYLLVNRPIAAQRQQDMVVMSAAQFLSGLV